MRIYKRESRLEGNIDAVFHEKTLYLLTEGNIVTPLKRIRLPVNKLWILEIGKPMHPIYDVNYRLNIDHSRYNNIRVFVLDRP
jgi:hypothetical protein